MPLLDPMMGGPAGMDGGMIGNAGRGGGEMGMAAQMRPTPPPGGDSLALANHVYALQQMVMQLQAELHETRAQRGAVSWTVRRDSDGRIVGLDASEG